MMFSDALMAVLQDLAEGSLVDYRFDGKLVILRSKPNEVLD